MPFNAKSYQFDARFWNKNVAQFTFIYFSINNKDIPQCEDTDHANVIFRASPRAVA